MTLKQFEARARIMKALAHPTRLFIVDRLATREYCVKELASMVGCDMSTMSKHLSILRNAGIVEDEKRGTCIYFTLRCSCFRNLFACTDRMLKTIREEQALLV